MNRISVLGRPLLAILCLSACTPPYSAQPAASVPETTVTASDPTEVARIAAYQAIENIRSVADLPASPLEFVEMTTMVNSPDGRLAVLVYQDNQGRRFMVEHSTYKVVEIDARTRLSSIAPDAAGLTQAALSTKAEELAMATVPGFADLRNGLNYEEGTKGDLHFFDWRSKGSSEGINPPFVQVGLHASGELVVYYNTLGLK